MAEQPLKILLATGLYPPEMGGPATYARMLEEELPKHGFALTVVPYGEVRTLSKWVRHLTYAKKLFAAAKDVDVIYALDPVSVGFPAWLVSVLRRKPLMVRLGGDYAWEQGQQRFGLTASLDEYTKNRRRAPLTVRVLATVQGFVVRRARRVVVPSNYLRDIVLTWGPKKERVRAIYSALFPLEVAAGRDALRTQLSFEHFTMLSVGRLVPWKGFGVLINVVEKLKQTGKRVTLVIAGDGPLADALQTQVSERKLENEVRLLGRLSKDALGAAIKASDCFVLNTGYEGLSHQILEVMDLGVPVVTTKVGGNPELVTDGVSGLMVDFNDEEALSASIVRIIENDALREHLIKNARARTLDFSRETVISELVNLITKEVVT